MMRMQMMRKLRCLAWFPCLLAFLLLPGAVHAKEYACNVTIPATGFRQGKSMKWLWKPSPKMHL